MNFNGFQIKQSYHILVSYLRNRFTITNRILWRIEFELRMAIKQQIYFFKMLEQLRAYYRTRSGRIVTERPPSVPVVSNCTWSTAPLAWKTRPFELPLSVGRTFVLQRRRYYKPRKDAPAAFKLYFRQHLKWNNRIFYTRDTPNTCRGNRSFKIWSPHRRYIQFFNHICSSKSLYHEQSSWKAISKQPSLEIPFAMLEKSYLKNYAEITGTLDSLQNRNSPAEDPAIGVGLPKQI